METGGLSLLGQGLVLVSLICAIAGTVVGWEAGKRKSLRALRATKSLAWGFAGSMILANLVMVYALVVKDFSVGYVAEVGSLASPLHISIVSLWASLNGSILFWGGVLGTYTALFLVAMGNKHREYVPYTLHVLLGISVFFTLMVATVADPFHPVFPVPSDGPGPNALLQNHWLMVVHPPTLYMGYVGMALPFSMLCGALLAGRLEAGWMAPLRRAMLVPWGFLTFGIILGGWWSYGVLGWGGYWAWDPVENASFHPWLTGTAFLHSAMVFQRRGTLRDWTFVLGMATFLLTLVGTFMTRSGVFNSVHSFTVSDIGPPFLAFIFVTLVYSVVLLALRTHTLDRPDDKAFDWNPLGREVSILIQNALFTVFTFTVLLGTLYPLIREYWDGRRVSVGEPYFDRWALPVGVALLFMMGVGPTLPWGRISSNKLVKRLVPPIATGLLFILPAIDTSLLSQGALIPVRPLMALSLFVCGYALHANMMEFIAPVRARMTARSESLFQAAGSVFQRGRRRYGGHIAHFGVILAVIGIALSKGYKTEGDFTLESGQTANFGDFDLTYVATRMEKQPHRDSRVVEFQIASGGRALGVQEPRLNYYRTMREPIGTPAIMSGPRRDLYLSLIQVDEGNKVVTVRAMVLPAVMWIWVAGGIMVLGTVLATVPVGRRRTGRAPAGATVGSVS